jgi:hypothetical protein
LKPPLSFLMRSEQSLTHDFSSQPFRAVSVEVFVMNLSPFSPITVEVEAVHTLKPHQIDLKTANSPSPSIDFVWSGVTKRSEQIIAPKSFRRFAFTATFSHIGLYNVGEEKTWKVVVHKTKHSGQTTSNVDVLFPSLTHYVEINPPTV